MSIKQVKISAKDISLGMYVSGLDRPWTQTPFPVQGVLVRSPNEIKALQTYCQYVYIDTTKGRSPEGPVEPIAKAKTVPAQVRKSERPQSAPPQAVRRKDHFEVAPIIVRRDVYSETVPLSEESGRAEAALLNLRGTFTLAVKQIAKGKDFDYKALKTNVREMVDSVIRCPDAFTWLMRLRMKDQYSHDHSLRAALWAVQFARYIGMSKGEMNILCLGTLLKDVGKLKLPNELLRKSHRNEEDEQEYRRFIGYGVAMLRQSKKIEPRVISIVHYHCERHDGSGFPQGLAAGKIPLLARIAGIATIYDAISNPRETRNPVAPSRAVSLLYNMRGKGFQEDLTVQFIQSVGLYPTGTLVELTTGDIGVVMEQNPKSRLTPQIVVVPHDADNNPDQFILVDLKDEREARKTMLQGGCDKARSVERLAIARDLEPSGYDIDMKKVSGLVIQWSSEVVESALSSNQQEPRKEQRAGFFANLRDKLRQ